MEDESEQEFLYFVAIRGLRKRKPHPTRHIYEAHYSSINSDKTGEFWADTIFNNKQIYWLADTGSSRQLMNISTAAAEQLAQNTDKAK